MSLFLCALFSFASLRGLGDIEDLSILWSGRDSDIEKYLEDKSFSYNARIFFKALRYYNNNDFENASKYFEEVVDRNIQTREAGIALVFLGKISMKGSSPQRSLSFFLDAHKKYSQALDPLSRIFSLSYTSAIYAQEGEFQQAGYYSKLIQNELKNLPKDFYGEGNFTSMVNIFSSKRRVAGWLDYAALVAEINIANQLLTFFMEVKTVPHKDEIAKVVLKNIDIMETEGGKLIAVKKDLLMFQPHLRASEKVHLTVLNHLDTLESSLIGLNKESKALLEEIHRRKKKKIFLSVSDSVRSKLTQEAKKIQKSGKAPNYALPPVFNDLIIDSDPNLR